MSRTKSNGLSYFPLDTAFFADRRIKRLISRFGADGALFYVYVLCEVYARGYSLPYTEEFAEDAASDIGCSVEKIGLMLNYLTDKSLLDGTLFATVKVISSHGIQAQYQRSMKGLRRNVEVEADSWLLTEAETEGFISVRENENKSCEMSDKSRRNDDNSRIYPLKEIKLNKTKLKESKGNKAIPKPPALKEVEEYCRLTHSPVSPKKFFDYYSSRNWTLGGKPLDWHAKLDEWSATEYKRSGRNLSPECKGFDASQIDIEQLKKEHERI